MRCNTRAIKLLRIATLFFFGIPTAYSQTLSAGLSGHVTDQSGADVPKAVIILESPKSSALQSTTDEHGHFALEVPPGDYGLKVSSLGFRTHRESIYLADTTSIKKDIVLSLSDCTLCVEVTLVVPAIETFDASLTSTLPLNPLPPLKLPKRIAR